MFNDADLAAIAKRDGPASAWHTAFSRHGADAPKAVHGDFAVGITAADGSVFLAVDRFAIRTMCYRIQDGVLRFSADARELAGPAPEIDPQAIFDYLYFHVIPSPGTIFKHVRRVPPGHFAMFRQGKLTVAPYWVPAFEEPRDAPFETLREEFRGLLRDGVARQLDTGIGTGCFLSGGTDSSTVAGLLRDVTGAPARTFSIGFDADGYDEMEYSRIAARHFGAEHHEYYITPDDLVASIPEVAASYDQPFGNSSVLPAFYCARLAREAGVGCMLGGDGGDELFGGNTRYAKQRVFGIYDHLPAALRKGLLEPMAGNRTVARLPLIRKAASYVTQAMVPMPDRMHTYNLLMRLGINEVLSAGFLAGVDADAPLRHQREIYATCTAGSLVNRILAYDWRYTLAETDLPKVVGATALAGVKTGFPLLDDRLVAFSARLPAHYKLNRLRLRWFFKEALRGYLPDQIITKKKQGFGLPFGVWTTRDAGLMRLAEDSLRSLGARGIVRTEFIDVLLKQHLHAYPGYYGEIVWIMMMLEQWLQAHAPAYRLG